MKKLVIIPVIFMTICSLCVKAQNIQPALNQVELMKKFIGTWQSARGNDTIVAFEMHEYDNAVLQTYYRTIKGVKRLIYTVSYTFDPDLDKFKGFSLLPDGRFQTWLVRFSSDKNSDFERVADLETKKVLVRNSVSLEDPEHMTIISYNSEKVKVGAYKWVRTTGQPFIVKPDSRIDQLASMQKILGKWQTDSAKDTMFITEWQRIGNVFTNITSRAIKGEKSVYYTQNVLYSSKEGIFRSFVAYPAGRYITYQAAFETDKKWKGAFVRNFNPDEVASTWEVNFPEPGQMIVTYFTNDGVKYMEYKWYKVSDEPVSLNQPENELPTKEIAASVDQIVAGWNTNKINTLFPLFLDSPDFTYVGIDGELCNYKQLINIARAQYEELEYGKYFIVEKKINILSQNTAFAYIKVSCEFKNLKGIIERYPNVGCSFIFNKIDSKWMVTHFQESTLPGETIKSQANNLMD